MIAIGRVAGETLEVLVATHTQYSKATPLCTIVDGYDPNGNRTGLNLVGTGLFTFAFDSLNRLATAQKPGMRNT